MKRSVSTILVTILAGVALAAGPTTPGPGDVLAQFELVGVTTPIGALTGYFVYDFTKHGWVTVEIHYPNSVAASYGNPSSDPFSASPTGISGGHNSDTTSYDFALPFTSALTPTTGSTIAVDPPGTAPPNLQAFLQVDNGQTAPILPVTGGAVALVPLTWTNLGSGLAGSGGVPALAGVGSLNPGTFGNLTLGGGKPSSPAILLISFTSVPTPFLGGTLLALPATTMVTMNTGAGSLSLPWSAWPSGFAANTAIYFQFVIQDPFAIHGVSISNALLATTP